MARPQRRPCADCWTPTHLSPWSWRPARLSCRDPSCSNDKVMCETQVQACQVRVGGVQETGRRNKQLDSGTTWPLFKVCALTCHSASTCLPTPASRWLNAKQAVLMSHPTKRLAPDMLCVCTHSRCCCRCCCYRQRVLVVDRVFFPCGKEKGCLRL